MPIRCSYMHDKRLKWSERTDGSCQAVVGKVLIVVDADCGWYVHSLGHRTERVSGSASSLAQAKRLARQGAAFIERSPAVRRSR